MTACGRMVSIEPTRTRAWDVDTNQASASVLPSAFEPPACP